MTKVEFVEKYAEKTGMSKKGAAAAVKAFFEVTANIQSRGYRESRENRPQSDHRRRDGDPCKKGYKG